MELLLLRAGLYQNRLVWPVTSAQQMFLQEQGLELPHSDARKWDSALPTISQATHLSVLSTSTEVEFRIKLIKVRPFRKRLTSRRGGEKREWDI